jgi:aminopeptidase N
MKLPARVAAGFVLLLAPAAAATRATVPRACPATAPFSVERYTAELDLDLPARSLFGRETVVVTAGATAVRALTFDAPGLSIEAAHLQGRPLRMSRDGDRLCVALDPPLAAGHSAPIAFRYRAGPSIGLRFYPDHVYSAYHTSHWLVSLDEPGQRAPLSLTVSVPAGLQVVGSGRALGVVPLARGREGHSFTLDRATPGFLFGFAAGRFRSASRQAGPVQLRALVPQSVPPRQGELENVLDVAAQALRFFEARAGVPFPGETYTQVFVAGDEMQEAAGFALQPARYLDELREDPHEDWLVVHELAHQFWAYLIPCEDFADFWLNEGLTSFMVAAFRESRWGRVAYEDDLARFRLRYAAAVAAGKDQPLAPRPEGATVRGITYSKGALVLNLLRGELGESAFWDGLRRYAITNAGRAVRTAQLQAAFEAASGKNLARLFALWVQRVTPAPLQVQQRWEAGELILDLDAGELAPLALDVAWVDPDSTRSTRRIAVTEARQTFRWPVALPPLAVRVDERSVLPVGVRHARSQPMLLYQLAHEPDAVGRLEALQQLVTQCPKATPACEPVRAALTRSSTDDASRLVRSEAQEALAPTTTPR